MLVLSLSPSAFQILCLKTENETLGSCDVSENPTISTLCIQTTATAHRLLPSCICMASGTPNRPPALTPGPVAEPQHSDQWDLPVFPAQVSAGPTHSGSPPFPFRSAVLPSLSSAAFPLPQALCTCCSLCLVPGLFCPADVHMAHSLPHFSPLVGEAVAEPWVKLCPSPPPQGPLLCSPLQYLPPPST